MSDGLQLRQSWYNAASDAEAHFRALLSSNSSREWKRVSASAEASAVVKGKARASATPELNDIVVHRKAGKNGDNTYRAVLDVAAGESDQGSLDYWKAVLSTPELRQVWDPAVEEAHTVEMLDPMTRVARTKYTLGWPANPRDAVTISRLFNDTSTIIDISTSLPRSPDEPAYLRPSPPYVRSNVTLFAWCIQHISPPADPLKKRKSTIGRRLRITCFWQHDLRAIWAFGSSSTLSQQLSTMMLGIYKVVEKRGNRVPNLIGYGNGVSIERIRFQIDRQALTIDYAIHPEDEEWITQMDTKQSVDDLQAIREHRRLTRTIECVLPSSDGWDVQISTKASSEQVENLPWTAQAIRGRSISSSLSSPPSPGKINPPNLFRVTHSPLPDNHSILKVTVVLELSGPNGLRLNGIPQSIQTIEERDPSSYTTDRNILMGATSSGDISWNTGSSIHTVDSVADSAVASTSGTKTPTRPQLQRTLTERSAAVEKSIISRVRRNYIYFSSLLQEPEAKWRQTTDLRGVSITQLDSIDPTLVVYRGEATFVGVGLWDLYGALVSPGARAYWDKQHDDATLLEDVNELTELWHFKTKPAWPVTGRDSVVLKTVYKSPTAIHVFSFSADDPHLFSSIPAVDSNTIRTQIDLQGWAIEALSPNTTLLTLLEQSDPKGWSNKASIPQQMVNMVAGIGEFAIKCGGPPFVTRLAGAKTNEVRYDHERGNFRVEYEPAAGRRTPVSNASDGVAEESSSPTSPSLVPVIECELRCDVDTWATSLDIIIDPPPQSISCLRRHRLSSGGGGLWLTITHDAMLTDDERILVIVRRGMGVGKEKSLIMINGTKVPVDIEELPESEIKSLSKQKRSKPARIPLDQPPVMGVIRRRKAEWDADGKSDATAGSTTGTNTPTSSVTSVPRFSSPLTKFFTTAFEQASSTTQVAVSAISPAMGAGEEIILSSSKPPMQYAFEALSWLQQSQARATSNAWTLISDKPVAVHRKFSPEVSPVIPVHRGEKVVEGVSAEEVASVVTSYGCRKQWDDRFDSVHQLEGFGAECNTSFMVSKGGFPFRDRGFYLASVMARARNYAPTSREDGSHSDHSNDSRNAIFCVSTSFSPDSVTNFSLSKYNSHGLPIGRVYVDGWILETLDPYTTENYAIPSTRCTRIVAVDYAGSIPAAVNSSINYALARSILAVETYMKQVSPLPIMRLPAPGLVLAEKKHDEPFTITSWKLRRRDENHLLVTSSYAPEGQAYHSVLLLTTSSSAPRAPNLKSDESTSNLSRLQRSSASTSSTPDLKQEPSAPSSPTPSLPPPRHRTISTISVTSEHAGVHERLRSSSSAFTVKGEVRQSTDLLVAEIVVDSKLYPSGYDVRLRSRIREDAKHITIRPTGVESTDDQVLPLAYAVYTIPASPLHSSGLNADRPPRHLLRLSLPTAQYQISTVEDPLTGELQSAPPKPQWLVDLEENGALVDIDIKPVDGSADGSTGMRVMVDGHNIPIANEKTSLTSLGRDELLDDKISKMSVLSRTAGEVEELPIEFKTPVGVADHLLEPSAMIVSVPTGQDEEKGDSADSSDSTPASPVKQLSELVVQPDIANVASGGLLGLFNSYSAPLSRFTSTAAWKSNKEPPTPSPSTSRRTSGSLLKLPSFPGGMSDSDSPSTTAKAAAPAILTPMFSLPMLLLVAVMSFLAGSLLRSLLSPAEFVYIISDLQGHIDNGGCIDNGWREMKRLFEMKYIAGGWDFQVALIQRH